MTRAFALALLLSTACIPAYANDSIAEIGAGGLILVQADAVTMAKEDLYVSPSQVKVDYVFHNNSDKDATYLVAFPMPDIDPQDYAEIGNGVPVPNSDNFLDFKVTVDGKDVTPSVEVKALSAGLDVTEKLTALGIPLNPLSEAASAALKTLPPEKLKELRLLGALYSPDENTYPFWRLHETYYWPQTFPANADVHVTHTYKPAVGGTFFTKESANDSYFKDRYCLDDGTVKAAGELMKQLPNEETLLITKQFSYILTTGANWMGPIGDFRLVVDKEDPKNVVSFCETGVKKIAPTQFEVTKKDFYPEKELNVMVITLPDVSNQ